MNNKVVAQQLIKIAKSLVSFAGKSNTVHVYGNSIVANSSISVATEGRSPKEVSNELLRAEIEVFKELEKMAKIIKQENDDADDGLGVFKVDKSQVKVQNSDDMLEVLVSSPVEFSGEKDKAEKIISLFEKNGFKKI